MSRTRDGDDREATVSIVLNNYESEIIFVNVSTPEEFKVVYSITDKASFQRASEQLETLKSMLLLRGKAVILVANKCELVRSRAVNVDDGRELAINYGAKFMEISVGMNHKCDDLLVGILHQLRLKEEAEPTEPHTRSAWTRNRSLMRASRKAKRLINRVMGKSDSKYKSCEDFNK
ncbi:GTP-binding protein RAD-like [Hyalella azteca]|uniref:GTP-binding protein RAD-like n=1 Tax=Hyalella azteca TaxID=294128 RepID=A0A8B7N0A8_HYAAZ|nr:GTP-binding protein RAD-like [Hyalella azteca]